VMLMENASGLVTPVPFDFDFSGLVDAEYATVAPQLATRSVRQRVFRGVCRADIDWDAAFAQFAAQRPIVLGLAKEIPDLLPRERADAVDYLEAAFATFAAPELRAKSILGACRGADAGGQ
jgi:hypothetical protein